MSREALAAAFRLSCTLPTRTHKWDFKGRAPGGAVGARICAIRRSRVAELVKQGMNEKEIAFELHISKKRARAHIKALGAQRAARRAART